MLAARAEKDPTNSRIAQQRDLLGEPKAIDEFGELYHKLEEAYNKNDAAVVVGLFTEDAVRMGDVPGTPESALGTTCLLRC